MNIGNERLLEIYSDPQQPQEVRAMASELLTARWIVDAAREIAELGCTVGGIDVPSCQERGDVLCEYWCAACIANEALIAYDAAVNQPPQKD